MEKYFLNLSNKKVFKAKINSSMDIKNHIIECPNCASDVNIKDNLGRCTKCKIEFGGPLSTR